MTEIEQKRFYQSLGERIKISRQKAGFKQEALADSLKLSRASIINIEKGRQHPPIHTLFDIAKILNVEISELLPVFSSSETISSEWKKVISKELKGDKQSKERVIEFIEEIKTKKSI